jgi:hypothetical protein
MTHLNTEELIALFYGEVDKAKHVEDCAECAKAYAALKSDMAEMNFPEPPERDDSYGKRVWASLAPSLVAYEAPPRKTWLGGGLQRGLIFAIACSLLIACAFLGGRLWERKQKHVAIDIASSQKPKQVEETAPPERIVVVVLSDHLDRSERLLVELKHAKAESGLASPLRDEARTLLVANRICRQKAGPDDDPRLAPALERLNHLLEVLANQSGNFDPVALARLQNEVNVDGLLFEVRVLRSGLPEQPAAATGHTKGDTI